MRVRETRSNESRRDALDSFAYAMEHGAFLIVEDDEAIARSLGRLFGRHRPFFHAATAAAARAAIGGHESWIALVVDIGLPDGSGLDVLGAARTRWPLMPALVLTGSHRPANINRSFALRADYLCKPGSAPDFEAFIHKALAREGIEDARVFALVAQLSEAWQLTPRESVLLSLLVAGVQRAQFPAELGITENTTKSLVRGVLRKASASSLDELARRILRQALAGSQHAPG